MPGYWWSFRSRVYNDLFWIFILGGPGFWNFPWWWNNPVCDYLVFWWCQGELKLICLNSCKIRSTLWRRSLKLTKDLAKLGFLKSCSLRPFISISNSQGLKKALLILGFSFAFFVCVLKTKLMSSSHKAMAT